MLTPKNSAWGPSVMQNISKEIFLAKFLQFGGYGAKAFGLQSKKPEFYIEIVFPKCWNTLAGKCSLRLACFRILSSDKTSFENLWMHVRK